MVYEEGAIGWCGHPPFVEFGHERMSGSYVIQGTYRSGPVHRELQPIPFPLHRFQPPEEGEDGFFGCTPLDRPKGIL